LIGLELMQELKQTIIHDFEFHNLSTKKTSVSKVECYVCGKGLEDGLSISAKTFAHGTVLFCQIHFSQQNLVKNNL
jgi:hypothetical protein